MSTPIKTTKAFYSCQGCGIEKRELTVAARNKGQDIVQYFEGVIVHAVSEDHAAQSPYCTHRKCDIGFQLDKQYGEEA